MRRTTSWRLPVPRWGMALLLAAAAVFSAAAPDARAQDVFFTQSGGRGLQNAKMNARMSKAETDIVNINNELSKIQPFAKVAITNCGDKGDKLRWTGTDWSCDQETDPTVQAFAKKALPTCGAGQMLSAAGTDFTCSSSNYVQTETDPTVQAFAKSALPSCSTGMVLTAQGGQLVCEADERGLTNETDPLVYPFAKTNAASIQNCEPGKVLSMVNDRLVCVFDAVGLTSESDPKVQPFARNDVPGAMLSACVAGQVVRASSLGGASGTVVLSCVDGDVALAPVLSNITLASLADVDISSPGGDQLLRYNGSKWVNSDDKVGSVTNGKWCWADSTSGRVVCDRTAPPPAPSAPCANDEILTYASGTTPSFECVKVASAVGSNLRLTDLADVSINSTSIVSGQAVIWNGVSFTNAWNSRLKQNDSLVQVVDGGASTDGVIQIVTDGVAALTANNGSVGIGTNSPSAPLEVNGLVSATNLSASGWINAFRLQTTDYVSAGSVHTSGTLMVSNTTYTDQLVVGQSAIVSGDLTVKGNFYVSGSQSIDGVTFANGGVSATGVVTATSFYGDGSNLTGIDKDVIVSGTTKVRAYEDASITMITNNVERLVVGKNGNVGIATARPGTELEVNGTISATNIKVAGNLYVSGSQTFDGVTLANGGVSATGVVTATSFYGDGSNLTGIDKDRIVSGSSNVGVNKDSSVTVSTNGALSMIIGKDGKAGFGGIAYPYGQMQVLTPDNTTGAEGLLVSTNANPLTGKAVSIDPGWSQGRSLIQSMNDGGLTISSLNSGGGTRTPLQLNGSAMYLQGGNVGISTSWVPNALLDVNGDISATNLRLSGNLYVSGSQTIEGVLFANGGVSATGTVSATRFSGDGGSITGVIASSADWYGLTRVPVQVQAVSDSGSIQMTNISATGYVSASSISATDATITNLTGTNVVANSGSFGNVNATGYVSAGAVYTSGTVRVSNTLRADSLASVGITRVGSDLYVGGNLYVSGSQSIDDVLFANGGVSASGTISATRFYGDGGSITGVIASSADWYGLTRIPGPVQAVSDSGSIQMANISATGYVSASSISATAATLSNISATTVTANMVSTTGGGTVSGTYGYFGNISGTNIYGTFTGDGSGLTGVIAGATDRIISGTNAGTSMIAISNTGFISVTQGALGTNTAWFDPQRGFVTIGVSSTGPISGTDGYFNGNVGIGVANPASKLHVSGTFTVSRAGQTTSPSIYVASSGNVGIHNNNPGSQFEISSTVFPDYGLKYTSSGPANGSQEIRLHSIGGTSVLLGDYRTDSTRRRGILGFNTVYSNAVNEPVYSRSSTGLSYGWYIDASTYTSAQPNSNVNAFKIGLLDAGGSTTMVGITPWNKSVGILTANPSQTLHVNGSTLITSWTGINLSSALNVTPTAPLEVSGTVSATRYVGDGSGLTGVVAASGDRIVSGTTDMRAIGATGFISLTQDAGGGPANTAWFDPRTGFVTIGVSSTGPISGTGGYLINTDSQLRLAYDSSTYVDFTVGSTGQLGITPNQATTYLKSNAYGVDSGRYMTRIGQYLLNKANSNWLAWGLRNATGAEAVMDLSNIGSILAAGNVGIGTNTPLATLQVSGTFVVSTTNTGTNPALYVSSTGVAAYVGVGKTPIANLDVSGTVSATAFKGDGSQLTNIPASAVNGLSLDRIVSGTASAIANLNAGISTSVPLGVSGSVQVSGTVQVAGTGGEGCAAGSYGVIRLNPTTGALQLCRQ